MVLIESPFTDASWRDLAAHTGRDVDRTVVWLRGDHDISTAAGLIETFSRAMALDEADLVVDLSEVRFMSGTTVRILMRTREILDRRSRSLTVRAPSEAARRTLDACGLADLLGSGRFTVPGATGAAAVGLWRSVPPAGAAARFGEVGASTARGTPIHPTRTTPSMGEGLGHRRPPAGG